MRCAWSCGAGIIGDDHAGGTTAFEERHAAVLAEWGGEAAEDRDEYTAENIFRVPPEARWAQLKAAARQATVGRLVDDAMAAIERDNPSLKDVLPRDYARPALDKQRLGQLIDLVSNIRVGDEDARSRDVLGRVYEHFLSRFASAERPSPRTWRHWGSETVRRKGSRLDSVAPAVAEPPPGILRGQEHGNRGGPDPYDRQTTAAAQARPFILGARGPPSAHHHRDVRGMISKVNTGIGCSRPGQPPRQTD